MNLINTLNDVNYKNFNNCDSLTNISDKKYEIILSNPPFGLNVKYEDIEARLNIDIDLIYKYKSNDSNILFLQLYLYILEENGLCMIVLPFGQIFNGQGNNFRKYFRSPLQMAA